MFKTIEDAYRANLIQLTIWLPDNEENKSFVNRWFHNLSIDPTRKVMLVKKDRRIAVFANDLT